MAFCEDPAIAELLEGGEHAQLRADLKSTLAGLGFTHYKSRSQVEPRVARVQGEVMWSTLRPQLTQRSHAR